VLGASSILIPLALRSMLGRSVDSLGILSSLVSVVGVGGNLLWGKLSDAAHRRKPFVILSYAVPGACLAGMALARSFELLVALNMLLNLFWVANASVTVLIAIENRDPREWETKIAHLNQVGALGWVFGLLLGSATVAVGGAWLDESTALRVTFAFVGVVGVLAAILAARTVPGTRPQALGAVVSSLALSLGSALVDLALLRPIRQLDPRRLRVRLRGWGAGLAPGTRAFFFATLVAYVGIGLFGIPLPLLLAERFRFPTSIVFLFFALQNAAVVAAYPWASRRIGRAGNLRVQKGALAIRLVLFAATAAALAFYPRPIPVPVLVVGFAVFGATWSAFSLSGTAIASRLSKSETRGRALGVFNGVAGVGWIIAGVGSGYLARWAGYEAAFACGAGFLALAILILHWVREPESSDAQDAPSAAEAERAPTSSGGSAI